MDFSQLSLLFVAASIFAIVARFFKQPLIVGYLFAGVSLSVLGLVKDPHNLESFSQIGVALLLFLLGLEVKLSEFSAIGKHAIYLGVGQIVVTTLLGTVLCVVLGFTLTTSVFLAFALTFSSTIVLVKLLSEKKDLASLYGRLSIGIMLVQDFVAISVLLFLTSLSSPGSSYIDILFLPVKIIALIFLVVILSKKVIPEIFNRISASSNELLFIVSVAWALGFSALIAKPFGLSLEIGGFLAGLALSNLHEGMQISSRARPIKDFFLVLFFLNLGLVFAFDRNLISQILLPALTLSIFILIFSPVIIMSLMGFLGYKKRTSFLTGISIAQISEFSLILIAVAENLGKIDKSIVAMVVLIGIITMTGSTYAIMNSEKLYRSIAKYIGIFERKKVREKALHRKSDLIDHIVLIGAHRTGSTLARYFSKKKKDFVIVDFDPKVYTRFTEKGMEVILGDISDDEIMDAANLDQAKIIISTISNLEDDLFILGKIDKLPNQPATIFTAASKSDAIRLYHRGATYVLLPEVLAGEFIRNVLKDSKYSKTKIEHSGEKYYERFITQGHGKQAVL